jgi:hypothetical protein
MKSFYFPHDDNARNDPKIVKMRLKAPTLGLSGAEAVGFYWMTVEQLDEQEDARLSIDEESLRGYAWQCGANDEATTEQYIKWLRMCIEIGLFEVSETCFWSESLLRRRKVRKLKANAGRKGGKSKTYKQLAEKQNDKQNDEQNDKQNTKQNLAIKEKERKENKEKENKEKENKEKEKLPTAELIRRVDPTSQTKQEGSYGKFKYCEECGTTYWTRLGHPETLCEARKKANGVSDVQSPSD